MATPVADRVPVIDVEKTCKETAAADKAMNLDLPQSVENCMRDENAARQQLSAVWSNYSASIRDRCAAEATIAGIGSYVDLLTCVQMTDPATLSATPALRGAGKNRNKNERQSLCLLPNLYGPNRPMLIKLFSRGSQV